jgi:predicted aldo/keto reductase-like oxidoreductase
MDIMATDLNRREFLSCSALAAGVKAGVNPLAPPAKLDTSKILNYNPNMEYRRLGKTNLMVSAICMGGHWKRVGVMMNGPFKGEGYSVADMQNINNPDFLKNRSDVVTRCMEVGINYVDACAPAEVLAYSKVLKGRRDKVYLGYSWHVKESRYADWRSAKKLVQGLEEGLKEAGLDYIDLWRISLPMDSITDLGELLAVEQGAMEALALAKKQGKARFTGVSSHNRIWLKSIVDQYPQVEVVLFPYTAATKEMPDDSIFEAVKRRDVGVFGIKPFADNSLFSGNSALNSPTAEEDSRRARLALRYILGNPLITAPIPGLVNPQQVDNAAKAVMERRKLDKNERAELDRATRHMWANLRDSHSWLKDWEYV